MADKNEIITIELSGEDVTILAKRIFWQINKRGCQVRHSIEPNLRPKDWARYKEQPTLAQLVVLAQKLNMRIIINSLYMVPRETDEAK
jgi:hypothetical protein